MTDPDTRAICVGPHQTESISWFISSAHSKRDDSGHVSRHEILQMNKVKVR